MTSNGNPHLLMQFIPTNTIEGHSYTFSWSGYEFLSDGPISEEGDCGYLIVLSNQGTFLDYKYVPATAWGSGNRCDGFTADCWFNTTTTFISITTGPSVFLAYFICNNLHPSAALLLDNLTLTDDGCPAAVVGGPGAP
jgi:hypothetical protein